MTEPKRMRLRGDEVEIIQNYRAIKEHSIENGLDEKDVKHGWIKSKTASLFFTNPKHEIPEFDPEKINWDFILKNIPKIEDEKPGLEYNGIFDRAVYSDTHIAMNPNPDGFSLYGGKWDESELMDRLGKMISHIVYHQNSNTLCVDDLGDLMDGWGGHTVRKGHELPQNMDEQKAFDVALNFKYQMFVELLNHYDEVVFNNICMDNHSGAFGYVVNSAFKKVVEATGTKRANVINHRRFINHYRIKDNIFIITHGKDDKNLKFGFKPKLDQVGVEKIDDYINTNYLLERGVKIEFSKGDSHQFLFDWSTSDKFNYFNFPAFSPSSNWIQTNYKKGKSGMVFFNYRKNDDYSIKPLFFEWKK